MDFKSKPRDRIAIAGGGIAGLACAKALLNRGAAVTVYEAGAAGQGALWASGGMLAGGFECAEANASPAFAELARRGMALWSDWAEDLGAARIGYRVGGVISPASDGAGLDWLDVLAERAGQLDIPYRRLRRLPERVRARAAIEFPADGELDNRLLGPCLAACVREAGGHILERTNVTALATDGDRVRVETHEASHDFDAVILATGVAGQVLQPAEPALSAIWPVKGQMLSLEGEGERLAFCLRARNAYVSQKPDGRLVIGATSEPGKYDTDTDDTAIEALRRNAEHWLPGLDGLKLTGSWAGIRPGTPDNLPILGPGALPGVYLALGLYRNGVLLAPAVGELMADAILSGTALPADFGAARFFQR